MPRTGNMKSRHQAILSILETESVTSVATLASRLDVSKETIRKDLKFLQSSSKVSRIHGGAALVSRKSIMPFTVREAQAREEKRKIGIAACGLIEENDTVIIEGSTTGLLLCEALLKMDILKTLTLITNSVRIANMMQNGKLCKEFFLLGGALDWEEGCTYGEVTISALKMFRANKAFISAAAVDSRLRVTSFKMDDVNFQRQALVGADKPYILADKSKFYRTAVFFVDEAFAAAGIVSDQVPDKEILAMLEAHHVEFVLA